jgi:uncharacterized protein (TIGR00369 family)
MNTTYDDPVSRQSTYGWGAPRSRTVNWRDPLPTAAAGATMSGADYLQAMFDGKLPRAPISALVGITAGLVEDGQVTFHCTPGESTYNPIGTIHGGLLCTLLDSVTACAVHSTLPAGTAYSTLEIKVSYLRSASAGVELIAVGRVTRRGRRVSFADGEIRDPQGRLVATATATCLIEALGELHTAGLTTP